MRRAPLVGVTALVEEVAWGVWQRRAALVPVDYGEVLRAVGARVVLLPPDPAADAAAPGEGPAADVLAAVDALVLSGGADVEPERYGQVRGPRTAVVRPDRDAWELALLAEARARDLPVLGICRGMELMCVEAGGALVQHLPDVVGHDGHQPAPGEYGRHGVRLAPGTLASRVLGATAQVRSYHHQGVASTGSLRATGWTEQEGWEGDASVEVVEEPGRRFALGLLWHPEVDRDERPFAALAAAAR